MTQGAAWVEGVRRHAVLPVAQALGLRCTPPRGAHGGTISPCPSCGRERRNASTPGERRGAIGIRADGRGWRCHPCDVSGDTLDLVALCIAGKRFPDVRDEHRLAEMREWCSRFLGIEPGKPATRVIHRTPAPEPAPPPKYLPASDVAGLWGACTAVSGDAEVSRWLASRGIDAAGVDELGLARALPISLEMPSWGYHAPDGAVAPWNATGHRLLVPLYDAAGAHRSVLARRVQPRERDPRKSTAPKDYARVGLVMACPEGAAMLAGNAKPANVVICEGEADFLLTAVGPAVGMRWPAGPRPAVLAMFQGGWTAEHAARVPDGARVVIATDDDPDGEKYAARIVSTFEKRARVGAVRLDRWRPKK